MAGKNVLIKKFNQFFIKSSQGFSIVELMIAMLIGLILITTVMSIYIATVKSSRDLLSSASLSQELTAVMSILVKDIRRSGYWNGVNKTLQIRNNPFYFIQENTIEATSASAFFRMPYAINISKTQDCISFAYDADNDTGPQIQTNDIFAFRLKNKAIQTLQQVNLMNFSKDGCADNAGRWMNITDSDLINISDLHIKTTNSFCLNMNTQQQWLIDSDSYLFPCLSKQTDAEFVKSGNRLLEIRLINIQIKAHLTSDSQVTKELSQQLRVRNDLVVIIP
jgi:prepilin peptidase dependent protein B